MTTRRARRDALRRRRERLEPLVYVGARYAHAFLNLLPWSASRSVARCLGRLAYLLDSRERRAMALENLRRSFPSWTAAHAEQVLKDVYHHLAVSISDTLSFVRLVRGTGLDQLVERVGFEKLEGVRRRTGIVFVTGHFGHWEVLGAALPLLGYPVWSVGRPLRNRLVDRYVRRMRQKTGQRMLSSRGAMLQLIRLLKRGQNVGLLVDQDARKTGVFVDFFGRPASTTPTPARLAIYTGAPIAFVYARRAGRASRFRIVLADLIEPQQQGDPDAEVRRITQRLTSDLEREIRKAPEEWLWLHRRWKTYPGKYRPV